MNTTQAQQKALDDALVAPDDRLEFGKCNMRLKTNIKPRSYIFMWSSIRFTINKKKVSLNVDIFRYILQFCPKIPRQVFEDLLLEQDILSFIKDLGHTGDITYLTDVNVDYLHQPWRAFATVIHKCLSGKEIGMEKIPLSQLLFQIEYKDAKKTNKMSYPRFTKIIIDYFMSNDPSISRRNKMFWHTARDDTLFTSMRYVSRHEDTQVNEARGAKDTLGLLFWGTYYAFASGEKAPKLKYIRKKADSDTSAKKKHVQATKGTRLKSKVKVAKPDKKKQPAKKTKAKGLAVLSKVALTEAEQIKLATKKSKKDFHVSHVSGSGDRVDTQSKVPDEQQQKTFDTDGGAGTIPGVPDVPPYESESDKESWGNSENEDDGDNDDDGESDDHDEDSDDERTKSDNDKIPDPNLTNVDQTKYEEKDVDDRVCTPSDYELTDDEKLNDEEEMDDEEDDEVIKDLYDDVNVKLGNDDTKMTDDDQGASEQQNVSQESGFEKEEEDAHVTLTPVLDAQKADEPVQSSSVSSDFTSKLLNLENPSPVDNEIASLLETSTHNTTAIPKVISGFTTTTPLPTHFFNPLQQQQTPTTFTGTTSINLTVTLPEIPNFASVFKFDQRVSVLESEMFELKQTNQFAKVISSIPGIVDSYLASKMKEAVDVVVQLQTNKLREEAQVENQEFLNQVDSTMNKIIKDQVKAQVSKIMPKSEKGRDDQDKDEDPSAGSDRGTKRRKSGKDTESSKDLRSKEKKSSSTSKDAFQSQPNKEVTKAVEDSGMQQDQEFVTGDNDEQPANKETWISQATRAEEPPTSFDEFNDTSFDFSAFVLNRLKISNLTQEILVGPAFNQLKGTCKSITELEYHLEECSKATTEHLDWNNLKNKLYPFDLRKPLPLIQDHRGCQIIPKDYFINKDLEYLKGGDLSRRYSTSVTKTKAATYELKWIKDLVHELWSLLRLERLQGYLSTVSMKLLLPVEVKTAQITTVSIKISTAGTYYCLCSVSAAGYKDTTVADLQLLEDLLLSRG
ncbi:hypothetical protein Tco_1282803 [Tanacetum coccineum]